VWNAVRDSKHKPAIELYISVGRIAKVSEKTLNNGFLSLSESTRKNRLNGWLLIQQLATEKNMDVDEFAALPNPALFFADLIGEMLDKKISDHLRETARPAM
jgi:hypothetical protein